MRELAYRWRHELASPPDALWPLVSDTSRFNRDTGVPPVERRGTGENARRRLRLRRLGVPIEWEEEPFEWVRPRRFGVVRRYLGGPLAEMRVEAELEERRGGGTTLDYVVHVRPRNLLGRIAAGIQIGFLSRRRFARAFREYDEAAASGRRRPEPDRPAQLAPGGRGRLERGETALRARGQDDGLVARLADLLQRGDELELARLRPYELAESWGAGRRDVLELFLHSTREGLTELRWDLMCPSCRAATASVDTLRELEPGVHCETCRIDFRSDLERSVEVTFAPSPAICAVERRDYCVGGPQVSPHVVAQQLLAPGEEREVAVALEPGSYRLRALGETGGEALAVDAAERMRTLTLRNDSAGERLLLLERTEWNDLATTAAEVTALQAFRDLFAAEVLRPGEPLSVGTLTVLFTDLRDSTRYYREVGDAAAFGSVIEHLDVLRETVSAEEGAVVKAMGDAIMAVFTRPVGAVRAALAAQRAVAGRPLDLKVGIHTGPCIAITQNDVLDYFGSTVNLAARLVPLSTGEDVVVSGAVLADPEVAELELARERVLAELKGFDEALELWRVRA